MGILTHERKCGRRFSLAASAWPPIQPLVRFTESGGSHWTAPTSVCEWEDPYGFFSPLSPTPPSPSPPLPSTSTSVREPSGDRLVTQRPWVSTREYGGWDCTGERGRDGDMPAMVKKKQRDASCFNEVSTQFWVGAGVFPPRLPAWKSAPAVHCRGLNPSVFPLSSMEQVCFFLMHREGWAKQMKTRTVHIIGRYFPPPCAHFRTVAVLGCSSSCQCLACMGEFLQWNPSWGTESLCSAIAEQRRAGLCYWQADQNGTRMVNVISRREHFDLVSMTRGDWYLHDLYLIHDARV